MDHTHFLVVGAQLNLENAYLLGARWGFFLDYAMFKLWMEISIFSKIALDLYQQSLPTRIIPAPGMHGKC